MLQTSNVDEDFDPYNPMVDLYHLCKLKDPNAHHWLRTPRQEDETKNSDEGRAPGLIGNYLNRADNINGSSTFLDYHQELHLQQVKLQQQLQQLQLLQQLLQTGNVSDTVSSPRVLGPSLNLTEEVNLTNEYTPPTTASSAIQSEPELELILSNPNDFTEWIREDNDSSISIFLDNSLEDPDTKSAVNEKYDVSKLVGATATPEKSPLTTADRETLVSTTTSNASAASHRYICNDCSKGFARASSLRTHRNIHTGDRPFTCPYKNCGKSFNARSNMLRHHKLHFKTDCGLYRLPNGETTSVKPSSRRLFALSKQQHQQFNALPTL